MASPPELERTCVWEERPSGSSRTICCGKPVMEGKPWCAGHWSAFQYGKRMNRNGAVWFR
jgi:hypothetical protein